jgi:hypothetical protein
MALVALLLAACGGEQQVAPTPSPESSPKPSPTPSHLARDFFPVTVVVETDKGWLTLGSVTRAEVSDSPAEVEVTIEGTIKVIRSGRFDYRLSLTDSEGNTYEDSGGIFLGERQEGENPPYRTSIRVPAGATFEKLGFWLAGEETPELSYLIDLPVAGIPEEPPGP